MVADTILEGHILDKVSGNLSNGQVIARGGRVEFDSKGIAVLEMAVNNAHLFWKMDPRLKVKSEFKFWYDVRK